MHSVVADDQKADRQGAAHRPLIALACLVSLFILAVAPTAGEAAGSERLLVSFKPGVAAAERAAALARAGATGDRVISPLGVHVIRVSRPSIALDRLRADRRVRFVERDRLLLPQDTLPNDPSFPSTFAVAGGAWGWTKTHTTQAWGVTRGDSAVVIAVLDTGLKTQGLSDFDGQTVAGWNVLNGSSNTSSSAGNHGTYVAGVIGLAMSNGAGNAGYCPGCRIMPIQVGTDSGAYLSDIASGITWAADHGARVENMSWAGSSSSSTLASAVSYARSKGVVLTAAAGNSNCDCPTYPSAIPGVIGVAGTTTTDTKQGDSNYGSWVKVAAPEGNMTSWPSLNGAPGYAPVGGTSLAAPVVAGIAGLLFSAKPSLTGAQVEEALELSAAPVGFAVQYGRVDALAALNYLGFVDPQPSSAPVNAVAPQIFLETNGDYDFVPLTAAPQAGQVLLRGQGGWSGSAPLSLSAVQWQRCDAFGGCSVAGTSVSYTTQATDAGYSFRLVVTVKNGLGSTTVSSGLSLPVGGGSPSLPPSNTSLPSISGTAQDGQTLTVSTGSWSGSPSSYSHAWQRCDSAGANCAAIAGAVGSSYLVLTGDVGSTLRVAVTASNTAGSSSAVSGPTAAVAAAPAPTPTVQTLTFSGSLNQKNPTRSFSVAVGAGAAHAELSFSRCGTLSLGLSTGASGTGPSVVKLDATLTPGTYSYQVSGGRCSFTLTITAPSP